MNSGINNQTPETLVLALNINDYFELPFMLVDTGTAELLKQVKLSPLKSIVSCFHYLEHLTEFLFNEMFMFIMTVDGGLLRHTEVVLGSNLSSSQGVKSQQCGTAH